MLTFQEMINRLSSYWADKGCAWHQGYDLEVGAGTFNPVTFLRCLGPEPYKAVYVEPSRRPKDGRYGLNPNRVQYYHQMQVIFKPSPYDIQELYLGSLEAIGLDLSKHDIRFVHDDWENPTIGASGLGWEVWIDGMEATQFTYFQSVGGITVEPVTAEITYGLERLAMYLQQVDSIFDIKWTGDLTYGAIYQNSEWQWSRYNFEEANTTMWQDHFSNFEAEAKRLISKNLPLPAYDFVIKASHAFNILDARGTISVSERARIMGKIRSLAHDLASLYIESRKEAKFPLLPPASSPSIPPTLSFKEKAEEMLETKDFLIEVGCEELPANAIEGAIAHFKEIFTALLTKEKIPFTEIIAYATPRRLALLIKGLASLVEAKRIEKKGPKIAQAFDEKGKPTAAGLGFFRSLEMKERTLAEVKGASDFEIREVAGHDTLYATLVTKPLSTYHLLAEKIAPSILAIDFPKKMRWGDLSIEFSRPIRWLVALYGDEVIPCMVGPVLSGRTTYGHRLQANQALSIKQPSDYESLLEKHFVMAAPEKRKRTIIEQIAAVEEKYSLRALAKEQLVSHVAHLVEWPSLVFANFDERYLQAPKEVLTSEMIEHQKYFPLEKKEGTLAPHFLAISNNGASELIAKGHRRAVSSRLADGLFLFEEDLKEPLVHFAEKLHNVTFHQELGSMAAKQERLANLGRLLIAKGAPTKGSQFIERAALLSKADLTTQLVGEFPHLQGLIGSIYAKHQNEDEEVVAAIAEHWMPKQEKGALPQSDLGIVLSLADKIDNLLSCFVLGLHPTPSSDPFALRRQAFGLLKIIIEAKLPFDLQELFHESFTVWSEGNLERFALEKTRTIEELLQFVKGRLRTLCTQMEFEKNAVDAVLSFEHRPYEAYLKLQTLKEFKEIGKIIEIYTRTKKILQGKPEVKGVDKAYLTSPEEKELYEHIVLCKKKLVETKDYQEQFSLLAGLQPVVTRFFDHVIVMSEDEAVRSNRLGLLHQLLDLTNSIVDLSYLQ